jgi:hypothetical protein
MYTKKTFLLPRQINIQGVTEKSAFIFTGNSTHQLPTTFLNKVS